MYSKEGKKTRFSKCFYKTPTKYQPFLGEININPRRGNFLEYSLR